MVALVIMRTKTLLPTRTSIAALWLPSTDDAELCATLASHMVTGRAAIDSSAARWARSRVLVRIDVLPEELVCAGVILLPLLEEPSLFCVALKLLSALVAAQRKVRRAHGGSAATCCAREAKRVVALLALKVLRVSWTPCNQIVAPVVWTPTEICRIGAECLVCADVDKALCQLCLALCPQSLLDGD